MAVTRRATVDDAEAIAEQRRRMWVDAGQGEEAELGVVIEKFVPWVRAKLEEGSYIGWLTEENDQLIAGAGLWVMEFPPHWMDENPRRAYLLNFYVVPEMRGRGLARELLGLAVAEAKAQGIKVVALHASKFGKPIYERNGFLPSSEMLLRHEP
jgi:GNAT superfamily N-acetyltransferase